MSETGRGHEQDERFTQRFIDAVGSVRSYNDRHTGMAGIASSFLVGLFEEAGGSNTAKVSRIDEANMERELVSILQADDLEAMGVALVDPTAFAAADREHGKDPHLREDAAGAVKRPVSLIMLISDPAKFTDTLQRLKPAPGQKEETQASVDALLVSTIGLIRASDESDKPAGMSEEEAAEAATRLLDTQIGIFMEISPSLVSQGFDNSQPYNKLSDYAARYSSGTLADYLGAESKGLVDTGFGPAKWPMDIGAGQLNERWTLAFTYLKELRDRDEPSPYFTELFNQLRSDFDTARAWLETDDDPVSPRHRYEAGYLDPLKAMTAELSKVWEEEFPLENAYYLAEKAEASK